MGKKTPALWPMNSWKLQGKLYAGKPGDDATVVVVKVRVPRRLTVLAGPPEKRSDDAHVVRSLMESPGKKVVCGGHHQPHGRP